MNLNQPVNLWLTAVGGLAGCVIVIIGMLLWFWWTERR